MVFATLVLSEVLFFTSWLVAAVFLVVCALVVELVEVLVSDPPCLMYGLPFTVSSVLAGAGVSLGSVWLGRSACLGGGSVSKTVRMLVLG